MNCYICTAAAEVVPSEVGAHVHFNCPECLEYIIPDTAMAEGDEQQSLVAPTRDVVFIRGWLSLQRIRQNTVAPTIPSDLIKVRK